MRRARRSPIMLKSYACLVSMAIAVRFSALGCNTIHNTHSVHHPETLVRSHFLSNLVKPKYTVIYYSFTVELLTLRWYQLPRGIPQEELCHQ